MAENRPSSPVRCAKPLRHKFWRQRRRIDDRKSRYNLSSFSQTFQIFMYISFHFLSFPNSLLNKSVENQYNTLVQLTTLELKLKLKRKEMYPFPNIQFFKLTKWTLLKQAPSVSNSQFQASKYLIEINKKINFHFNLVTRRIFFRFFLQIISMKCVAWGNLLFRIQIDKQNMWMEWKNRKYNQDFC